MRRRAPAITAASSIAVAMAVWPMAGSTATPEHVQRLSLAPDRSEANSNSAGSRISADGRRVVFASDASNLVAGDAGGHRDVFVADVATGLVQRVSVSSTGAEGNADSMPNEIDLNGGASLSADGRHVAFESTASNLVKGDSNNAGDIFVRDLKTQRTKRVSLGKGGREANGGSLHPALSASGRYVAFASSATNLVGGDTNKQIDIFVRDLKMHRTRLVSVAAGGGNGDSGVPSISANGRRIAFESNASNAVAADGNGATDVFVADLRSGEITLVSSADGGATATGASLHASISGDGRSVSFTSNAANLVAGDTNDRFDVFARGLPAP